MKLKTLEDRVTKLENFITERLDQVINSKINNSENYLLDKIREVDERVDDEIDDVRSEIPDTYDLDSQIEGIEGNLATLDSRINGLEMRVGDVEG